MLNIDTVMLAYGFEAISIFAGDDASTPVISALHDIGVKYITIRAVGHDNVYLPAARTAKIKVANVPAYSPYAIAEHSLAMLLALNRKIVLADRQVHRGNFTVNNLMGFDLHGKTIGLVGTGTIGSVAAKIFHGFSCKLLAYDISPDTKLTAKYGLVYTTLDELCAASDIIALHTCLTHETKYLINSSNISLMKKGVFLINTARGAVMNTTDIITGLENGTIGALGMDVYEHEKGLFFYDHSAEELNDPMLSKLMAMPNVLITPHQAFATNEALMNISDTTIENLDYWSRHEPSPNEL